MWSLKTSTVLVILWYFTAYTSAQISKKFFRGDYTYIDATQSFYKIHTIQRNWYQAKKICAQEGAHLFYPEHGNEADRALEFLNATQPFDYVYVGASATLVRSVYETIYGVHVQRLYHKWAPGEPDDAYSQNCMMLRRQGTLYDENCARVHAFICKKSLASLQWNNECSMPNTDYEYNQSLKRCYKFHQKPLSWSDAYVVCSVEQSYLTVIDNQEEADHLTDLVNSTKTAAKETSWRILVGFHNRTDEGWITTRGVPLNDSGFNKWAVGKPSGTGGLCGSMLHDGTLSNIACDKKSYFICEHDVEPWTLMLDLLIPRRL